MATGHVFSTILILTLLVLAAGAARYLCVAEKDLVGYWATPEGALFELFMTAPRAGCSGELRLATASGAYGARPGETYRVQRHGCRRINVEMPLATLRGKAGLDRRRILWRGMPTWYRQGL